MVIVRLISGLGNQLFQYVIAKHLATVNYVELKLDVSFFQDQSLRKYSLDNFNISDRIATKKEIDDLIGIYTDKSLYAKVFRKAEKFLPKYKRTYYKEDSWWTFESDLFRIKPPVYLEGYWQHYRYFENLDLNLDDLITVREEFLDSSSTLIKEIDQTESAVSLHIRRGDYSTDLQTNAVMGLLPLSYYQEAIGYMVKRIKNPSFYIFSDDLDWAKDNLKIQFPVTLVDLNHGQTDYLELDLMARCKHNIIANSSFSWWGAFLNKNPDKIVIAPKRWVSDVDVNEGIEIQFPSWIKL